MMNSEVGFVGKVLSVIQKHGISFEHLPSGIDTVSLVIDNEYLKDGILEILISEMKEAVQPDKIYAHENIALVATVGHGMAKNVGTSARLFKALSQAGINVNMIDQGSSELNIIVGVPLTPKCWRPISQKTTTKTSWMVWVCCSWKRKVIAHSATNIGKQCKA